ncbi:MAG TPA: hypothetical protein PKY82_25200 [Pyrinomonadaceae bacterium]|nr:hypothetical protein [Pyrinomonadaceae bacterium]
MKINFFLAVIIFSVIVSGCGMLGSKETASNKTTDNKAANSAKNTALQPAGEPKLSEAKPPSFQSSAPDTNEAVKFPYSEFPKVETTAKAGEYVIVPSYNWIKDAAEKGVDSTSFIWYVQKMAQPDKENSEIQFMSERRKVPNAYIVAISPGQKAKVGDILLTWWQTGSGIQRAIVVDDKDPLSPIVRYLDIDYDNPAKSRDNVTTIGKMDEKIVADSFFKIKDWDAGTTVAVQDGANLKKGRVIRVADDKVLVLEGVGKLKVYPKSACKPVAITPNVKEGDRVKVPFVGNFKDATVSKVDAKIGRVFVKFDGQNDEKAIPFGDVIK